MLHLKFSKNDQKPLEFCIKHLSKDSREFYLLTATSELALDGRRMRKLNRADVLVAVDAGVTSTTLLVYLKLQHNHGRWLRARGRSRIQLSSKKRTAWKFIPVT